MPEYYQSNNRLEVNEKKRYTEKRHGVAGQRFREMEMDGMNRAAGQRLPLMATLLVTVNVVIFLLTDFFFFQEQEKLAYYMAMNPVLVTKYGEYWRLFTSMFYHFDIEHVLFNMVALYFAGTMLEPFFGKWRYLLLYFASGLFADVASVFYYSVIARENAEVVFAAGASGAVYGLIGAYVSVMLFFRERLSREEKIRIPLMVFVLLFGNLSEKSIGHAAHFGGFIAGGLLGFGYCVYLRKRRRG